MISAPFGDWTLTITAGDRLIGSLPFRVTQEDGDLEPRLDLDTR